MLNIEQNKQKFINLIKNNVTRQGAEIDKFIRQLEGSDFFTAPASTNYHGNFDGGLC